MDSARDAFLTQHVTEPTHYRGNNTPNTLDLIFTNEEGMSEQLKYLAPVGSSHHSLLKFLTSVATQRQTESEQI